MSSSRIGVEIASLVCSVVSTMWPVIAARSPVSTVSRSRISPTSTMSGSCRKVERKTLANVSPILSLTCTWLMPGRRYSTGSSTVMILVSGLFISLSAPYSVVVLPEPVGPVTSNMPCAWPMKSDILRKIGAGKPRRSSDNRLAPCAPCGNSRNTTDSPNWVGMVEMRMSIAWLRILATKRPSCGSRRSAISRPLINFRRCTTAGAMRLSASVWIVSPPSMRKRICSLRSCGST